MRFAPVFIACMLLTACASDSLRHCADLAGSRWSRLPSAPPNAAALLAMEGIPNDVDALWFGHGPDALVACIYSGGLTSPGCGAATVYEFARRDDRWGYRHMAMEACDQ